jgi:probable selenium-dependent hydroxylase accessory protein YqeC
MWHFQRIDPLESILDSKYVTFVGSGGKTTFMEYIAKEAAGRGKSVAITTTTKIYAKEPYVLFEEDVFKEGLRERFIRVGKTLEEGKLTGVTFSDIDKLGRIYDMVLIEADGAKGKPLKFPAHYEPVIPPLSEKTFVLCGLDGLSGRVDEKVFRWEPFSEATRIRGDAIITPDVFLRFFSEDILLKGIDMGKCTIVFNKYDVSGIGKKTIMEMAKDVILRVGPITVIVSSLLFKCFYLVRETDGNP